MKYGWQLASLQRHVLFTATMTISLHLVHRLLCQITDYVLTPRTLQPFVAAACKLAKSRAITCMTDDMLPRSVWPEAQVVNGKSTVDTFYLTSKQSDAVNSPFFRQHPLLQHEGKCIERWLTYTTDDGLDQRGVRARLGHTMEKRRYEYFIGFVCLCHSLSNGAKQSLALADHLSVAIWQLPPYVSSIAK